MINKQQGRACITFSAESGANNAKSSGIVHYLDGIRITISPQVVDQ